LDKGGLRLEKTVVKTSQFLIQVKLLTKVSKKHKLSLLSSIFRQILTASDFPELSLNAKFSDRRYINKQTKVT